MPSSVESSNPLATLAAWIADAEARSLPTPSAMALATANPQGWPSVRFVFCRGLDDRGVRFFTNYESRKAREIDATGRAAAAFHWPELERQARVEGHVVRATAEESDVYFASRARGSQIASSVSPQSLPIAGLDELRTQCDALDARRSGDVVERPSWWGGYWLLADAVELWHGGTHRLHDRIRYERVESGWRGVRLGP